MLKKLPYNKIVISESSSSLW